jgi:signal transduction histidine kinase
MTRPWIIWVLSLFCAAGIFGAMGVITHRTLTVEQEVEQARADAGLQERLRIALWSMETEAATLLIEENNRPPEHFRPVSSPPSPLLGVLPVHVKLHFDIASDGTVVSPQVPRTGEARHQVAEANLKQLRLLLSRSPSVGWCSSVVEPRTAKAEQKSVAKPPATWDNNTFLEAAAANRGPFDQGQSVLMNNAMPNDTAIIQNGLPIQEAFNTKVAEAEAAKQMLNNVSSLNMRGQVYLKSAEKNPLWNSQTQARSSAAAMPKPGGKLPSGADGKPALQKEVVQAAVQAVQNAPLQPASAPQQGEAAALADRSVSPVAPPIPAPEILLQRVTPFSAFWLEDELFLVREVIEAGRRHVQGVWLDAVSLKASLLEATRNIVPKAVLQPVATMEFVPSASGRLMLKPALTSGDPMDLVGLPWKLVPGEKPIFVVEGWTPMRLTLAAAWLGALLAALAAAALLFGVTRLSERRAAFVSSVTHELRTPLTTFRLYSELLEQGMVREEADRTQYLHTLRSEAERLTHLVDNVLAYSRIERTHRRSRMERVALVPWIERVRGRLEDRTREAGMTLAMSLPHDDEGIDCVTDATALEQILFNLVDNACKYAAGRCREPVVHVALERHGRWVDLRVCDSGPGIARGERSRLFRPFHKSADEAANSKPGVGLGLALCHRLARALGGKLTLERPADKGGACFVLRLPAA